MSGLRSARTISVLRRVIAAGGHDHRLAEAFTQVLAEEPTRDIGRTARRKRHLRCWVENSLIPILLRKRLTRSQLYMNSTISI